MFLFLNRAVFELGFAVSETDAFVRSPLLARVEFWGTLRGNYAIVGSPLLKIWLIFPAFSRDASTTGGYSDLSQTTAQTSIYGLSSSGNYNAREGEYSLSGTYEIEDSSLEILHQQKLGSGNFGVVYKGILTKPSEVILLSQLSVIKYSCLK